jgi:hypothetical protein
MGSSAEATVAFFSPQPPNPSAQLTVGAERRKNARTPASRKAANK